MTHPIDHFVRTPNGRALLAVGEAGEMAIWSKEKLGKVSKGQPGPEALLDEAQWMETRRPAQTAIFAKGRAVVSCCGGERGEAEVVLRHLDGDSPAPSEGVALPSFSPEPGDDVKMLLAVSDVDDGFSGRRRKSQRAIIIAASKAGQAWVWRITWRMDSSTTDNISVTEHQPEISLLSQHQLPVEGHKPHLVLQVDPMGWHQSVIDWKTDTPLQDMILTVSREGVLEFWTPQLGHHFAFERTKDGLADTIEGLKPGALHDHSPWSRSGLVRTGRANPLMARCSSRKKTVLGELDEIVLDLTDSL
jgi:hypothetical protein